MGKPANPVELLKEKGNQAAPELARRAADDPDVLAQVMAHVTSPVKRVKNGAAKTVKLVSEDRPEVLVPYLTDFIRLMGSQDTITRWIAMDVVGNLAGLDAGGALNRRALRVLLDGVRDPALVTAGHAVDNLGKIGLFKPRFRRQVTDSLLQADEVDRARDCRAILAGKVIQAVSRYVNEVRDGSEREAIAGYARRHLRSHRPATKKKAEKLLSRLPEPAGPTVRRSRP